MDRFVEAYNIQPVKWTEQFDLNKLLDIKYTGEGEYPNDDFGCGCGCYNNDEIFERDDLEICQKKPEKIELPADMLTFYKRYGAPAVLTVPSIYDNGTVKYGDKPDVYFLKRLRWDPWIREAHTPLPSQAA